MTWLLLGDINKSVLLSGDNCMYYEEICIEGQWYYRVKPYGEWIKTDKHNSLENPIEQNNNKVMIVDTADYNYLMVQLDTLGILLREDNFRPDNRATFERMISTLKTEFSKYENEVV